MAGCEYDVAVLTNITQDHLDFHETFENYRKAKALLFESLHTGNKPDKCAIFNMDDKAQKSLSSQQISDYDLWQG